MRLRSFNHATTPLTGAFRLSAISVGLASAVLAGSAIPASAAPGDPVVSFIDMGGYPAVSAQLKSSALDGTATTPLAPAGLNSSNYSLSGDGNTLATSGWTGAFAANDQDTTYGTLVTRRVGSAIETRILSSQYTANPVVSPDGLSVWFLNGIYSSATKSTTLALYKYDVIAKTTTRLSLAAGFQPVVASGSTPIRLAISPNGNMAAIVYRSFYDTAGNPVSTSRVFAARISDGKTGNYFEQKTIPSSPTTAYSSSLAWADDNSTLTFSTIANANNAISNYSVAVTSSNATVSAGPLADWYDVTRYNGEWWMWQDDASNPVTSYGHSTDPSPVVAPSTTTTWGGSYDVRSFRLSAVTPPAIGIPVNKPAAHPGIVFNTTSVGYKKSTAYFSYNDYMVPIAGQVFADSYSETQRGVLETSIDGRTYKPLLTTTAAHPVKAGGYTWTANTPAATRTLYYRWRFAATTFAAAGLTAATKITMIPTVSATITKSGSNRKIVGTATRVGGSVTLYKVVGTKLTKVSTKTMNSKGQFNFGTIYLKAGNYRLSTVLDGYAGVGSKNFKV
jgi:hypothetical protein